MKQVILLCTVLINLNFASVVYAQKTARIEYSDGRIYTGQKKGKFPNGNGKMVYPRGYSSGNYTEAYKEGIWTNGELQKGIFYGITKNGIAIEIEIPNTKRTTKYTLPDKSSFLYTEKGNGNYVILYPDSSFFIGACTNQMPPRPQKGIFHYKNGDIVELEGDPLQPLRGVITFSPKSPVIINRLTFHTKNGEIILPERKIHIPWIPIHKEDIRSQYSAFLYQGLIESSFWNTGRYPSIILAEKIDSLKRKIESATIEANQIRNKLATLPSVQYSGFYETGEMGKCIAEYSYKEYEGIRYKDGDIHCYIKPTKTVSYANTFKQSRETFEDLTGSYKLGQRSGIWIYKKINNWYKEHNDPYVSPTKKVFDKQTYEIEKKGEYKENKRNGVWTLTKSNSTWINSKKKDGIEINSVVHFANGIFVSDFLYEELKYRNSPGATNKITKTKVQGQFTMQGVIDGIWTIEHITYQDGIIFSHEVETCQFDDGQLIKWEQKMPMSGAFKKYTATNGFEYGNIEKPQSTVALWLKDMIDTPLQTKEYFSIQYDSSPWEGSNILYPYFIIWHPLANMKNPIDNEEICKYYARYQDPF